MMRHVSRRDLDKLTCLIDGTLDAPAADRLRLRINERPELAQAYRRLVHTRELLRELGRAEPPAELPFRQIEAQARWRAAQQSQPDRMASTVRIVAPRSRRRLATIGAALAGLVLLGSLGVVLYRRAATPHPVPAQGVASAATAPAELAALAVVSAGDVRVVMADGAIMALPADRPVLVGERVITGDDGSVTLQWQSARGLRLDPGSELELRRLDRRHQQLVLWQGQVTVQLAHTGSQGPQMALELRAGRLRVQIDEGHLALALGRRDTRVEVYRGQGLAFADEQDPGRGKLLPEQGLTLRAGRRLRIRAGSRGRARPQTHSRRPTPLYLQPWSGLHRALAQNATVQIEDAPGGTQLSIDGVAVGPGNAMARCAPGRHLVELRRAGRQLARKWIGVQPGQRKRVALAPQAPSPPAPATEQP